MIEQKQKIKSKKRVGMGEYSIEFAPNILKTTALGSCIGTALYDKYNKIGGLIHIMLPEKNNKKSKITKYADPGIPFLIEKMEEKGAKKRNMIAKIAGGAQMFNISGQNGTIQIGKKNIKAVNKVLKKKNIKIMGKDVGKDFGRTMTFYTKNGDILITSHKQEDKNI